MPEAPARRCGSWRCSSASRRWSSSSRPRSVLAYAMNQLRTEVVVLISRRTRRKVSACASRAASTSPSPAFAAVSSSRPRSQELQKKLTGRGVDSGHPTADPGGAHRADRGAREVRPAKRRRGASDCGGSEREDAQERGRQRRQGRAAEATRPPAERFEARLLEPIRARLSVLAAGRSARGDRAARRGLERGEKHQVLLGVTGSGKTFTMANVIERVNRPTLVMSHNKTLAAQLYERVQGASSRTTRSSTSSATTTTTSPRPTSRSATSTSRRKRTINEEIDRLRLRGHRARCSSAATCIIVASRLLHLRPGLARADLRRCWSDLEKGEIVGSRRRPRAARRHPVRAQRHSTSRRGTFRVRGDVARDLSRRTRTMRLPHRVLRRRDRAASTRSTR